MKPSKAGYFWALWVTPAPGTLEAELQSWPKDDWGIVEVWDNFLGEPCEADEHEKFGVSVHGVEKTQWVENFKWGSEVASRLDIERLQNRIAELESHIQLHAELDRSNR